MRNPLRLSLTVLAGAVGVTAFVFLRTVVGLFYAGAELAQADRLVVRHKVSLINYMPLSHVQRIASLPEVRQVAFMGWFGGRYGESQRDFFPSMYVDPDSFLSVYDELTVPPEQLAAWRADPCGALVGRDLVERFGWRLGERVTLRGDIYPGEWTFTVRGIYGVRRSGVETNNFYFGYRCLNERLPQEQQDQVSWLYVRVKDPSRASAVAAQIDALFTNSPYPTKAESERAFTLGFLAMYSAILTALQVVSVVVLLILLLVIGNTLAMSVRERARDLATLRALGFHVWRVVALVLAESALIGLASAGLGLAVSPQLVRLFVAAVGSQFGGLSAATVRPQVLGVAGLSVLVVALVAGVAPAWRAARLPVAEGLRKVV